MELIIKHIEKWFPTKRIFLLVYSFVLIISGTAYLVFQYNLKGEILDAFFIGLLFGSSYILLFGMKWIKQYFIDELNNFHSLLSQSKSFNIDLFKENLKRVFKSPYSILVGILYGLAVGYTPFLYELWPETTMLSIVLCLFLFTVNFLTGLALYSLFSLFQFLYSTSKSLEIHIHDVKVLSVFITTLSKRASIIAAFYVAFAISSIYFSIIPIDILTIAYSIFSALIILAAYIIPIIPISAKTSVLKKEIIHNLSFNIQREFDELLQNVNSKNDVELDRYNKLIELRENISKIQTIPIGFKAIWNALYIVIITFLPVVLQVILEKSF